MGRAGRKPPQFGAAEVVKPTAGVLAPAELYADGVLSVRRAARFLGVRPGTVRDLIAAGEMPSIVHCRRRVVPRVACVMRLAELHREQHAGRGG
jgi:excisionase family DNA binding protein